jgi:hypothetical protein
VRGGPSNVNNEIIRTCAKAARDMIGPAQIAVTPGGESSGGGDTPAPASGTGSAGSGS